MISNPTITCPASCNRVLCIIAAVMIAGAASPALRLRAADIASGDIASLFGTADSASINITGPGVTWTSEYIPSANRIIDIKGNGHTINVTSNNACFRASSSSVSTTFSLSDAIVNNTGTTYRADLGLFRFRYNSSKILNVDNATFQNFLASNGEGSAGVLEVWESTVNVNVGPGGVVFRDNVAQGSAGGAVGVLDHRGSNAGHLIFSGPGTVKFLNNSTVYYGGAMSLSSNGLVAFQTDVVFEGNWANNFGGAIDVWGYSGTLLFSGSTLFLNNYIYNTGNGVDQYSRGGGINIGFIDGTAVVRFDGPATFTGNRILAMATGGNRRHAYGGALSGVGDSSGDRYSYEFNNVAVFRDNFAFSQNGVASGGAIYFSIANASISFTPGTEFINNYAGNDGGAMYFDSGAMTLNASDAGHIIFRGNRGGAGFEVSGADILPIAGSGTASSIHFAGNTTLNLNATGTGRIEFHDPITAGAASSAVVNKAGDGAVVFYEHASDIRVTTNVQAGLFQLLSADGGAASYGVASSGTFTASSGTAVGENGAFLRAARINISTGEGGALWSNAGLFTVQTGSFVLGNNSALGGSGTINVANASGPLVNILTPGGTFYIEPSLAGAQVGSAGALSTGTLWIASALTGAGQLVKRGMGVYVMDHANSYSGGTIIRQGTILANAPGGNPFAGLGTNTGFGIRFDGAASDEARLLVVTDATLSLRSSIAGGATGAIESQGGLLTITAPSYDGNGGAILAGDGSTLNLTNNILVTGNIATGNGGAIYLGDGSRINLLAGFGDTRLAGNTAAGDGGAIFATGDFTLVGNLLEDGLSFLTGNTAGGRGGAIYTTGSFALSLERGTFIATGNRAGDGDAGGGFLYASSGTMLFDIGGGASAFIGDDASIASHADSLAGGAGFAKTGGGFLALWGNSALSGGALAGGGTLAINGILANAGGGISSGAEVYVDNGGLWSNNTLSVGDTNGGLLVINSGTVTTAGAAVIASDASASGKITIGTGGLLESADSLSVGNLGAGRLSIAGSGSVALGGRYSQNAASTLALDLSGGARAAQDVFITAQNAILSGTLHVAGYTASPATATAASQLGIDHVLIRTTDGIAGDFTSNNIGSAGTLDFLLNGAFVSGNDYVLGSQLAWHSGARNAHGGFTLGAGGVFDIDIVLADVPAPNDSGWTGNSLTLTGANQGTLILSKTNTYTGTTTVNGGILSITGVTGGAEGVIGGGAADVTGRWTIGKTLSVGQNGGAGTLRVAQSGTVTARENITIGGDGTVIIRGLLESGNHLHLGATGGNGLLRIEGSGSATAASQYNQYAGGTLALDLSGGARDAFVTIGTAALGGALIVENYTPSLTNASKASQLAIDRVLIRTTDGITGDFASKTGVSALPAADYLVSGAFKLGNNYVLGSQLVWTGGAAMAHGNFTLAAGAGFDVDEDLANQSPDNASGWDGKSLTLAGANRGTLILSASNTYTGDTAVLGGLLSITGHTGSNAAGLINGGTVNITGTWTMDTLRIGTGDLDIAAGGLVDTLGDSFLASNAASSRGLATVEGLWRNAGDLTIGSVVGAGVLTLNGGTVSVVGASAIGGSGTVRVTDGFWEAGQTLIVGSAGNDASLFIEGSGSVTVRDHGVIGDTAGATGAATVADSALWNFGGDLQNGAAGSGLLSLRDSGSIRVTGDYSQNAASLLDINLDGNPRGAFITANTAALSGSLTVTGLTVADTGSTASQLMTNYAVLIRTGNAIAGDFDSKQIVISSAKLPDFIIASAYKAGPGGIISATGTDYVAGLTLGWLTGAATAHGDFTIAPGSAFDTFDVDHGLADQTAPGGFASGWDGKSLTLTGGNTGHIILSASNAYTGTTTVNGGTLSITGFTGPNAAGLIGAGADGFVHVSGTWQNGGLVVGVSSGAGALLIDADGLIATTGHAYIGGNGNPGATAGAGDVSLSESALWTVVGNLYNGQGAPASLFITDNGGIAITGTYFQDAGGSLNISLEGPRDAHITAAAAQVSGTFRILGFSGTTSGLTASSVIGTQQTIIRTTGGITGEFLSIDSTGTSVANDYLLLGAFKTSDDLEYRLGYGLVWFSGTNRAHGKFTLNAGETFDMDETLSDVAPSNYNGGWDGKSLTLSGTNEGTLILSASNTYTGTTTVNGGTLAITAWTGGNTAGLIGAGADDTGGVAITGTGLWRIAGGLRVGDAGAGALTLRGSGSAAIDGAYSQNAASTLTLDLGDARGPFITAQTAALSGSLVIDGFTDAAGGAKASEAVSIAQVLIRAAGGITGDFDSKTINGASSDFDYLVHNTYLDSGGDYVLGTQLAWNSGTVLGHGTFTVDAGASFDVDVSLADQNAHGDFPGWDGKSLAKDGAGLLILSASNAHTGTTTVAAGELRVTHTAALGAGHVGITGGATLSATFNNDYTFTNNLSGSGLLAIDLGSPASTFNITQNIAAMFTGTVRLLNTAYTLENDDFASATLMTADGSHTIVGKGINYLAGLTLDGGRIDFDTNVPADITSPAFIIATGTINLISGTIGVRIPQSGESPIVPQTPLLQQDEGVFTRLAYSATTIGMPGDIVIENLSTSTIVSATQTAAINQSGTHVATGTYGYGIGTKDGAGNNGLHIGYNLVAINILENNTLLLDDNDSATNPGGDEFHATISGDGSLALAAANAITLNAGNTYTGTTTIITGTIIIGQDNALGRTRRLELAAAATLDLNGKAQTIGSGTINGALAGSGSLGLAGLVEITGANPAFSADIGITGTTVADNTAALGDTGALTIAADAEHRLDNATGVFSKTLDGPGSLALANNSVVTLTADNAAYIGTFALAEGTRLIASTDANLGSANLTGAGTFEKQNDATTITLTHANTAFTGATIITGGTLALSDLAAPGSGDIANNASLDLAAPGIFANNITGSGTTHVGASLATPVILTGVNQTTWHITGAAQVSTTENLGAGATRIDGALTITAATAWDYANALTGAGLLSVNLSGADFSFNSSALQPSSSFTGTVALASANFTLASDNTAILENATLQLDADSHATVGDGIQQVAGLTLNGGTLTFTLSSNGAAAGIIDTQLLDIQDTILRIDTTGFTSPGGHPILQQDDGQAIRLIDSAGLDADSKIIITGAQLIDHNGDQLGKATQRDIVQDNAVTASGTYDFAAIASGSGLLLDYTLTALDLLPGQTTVLDNDIDNAILAGADELLARLTGSGNLRIDAAGAITLANVENAYTGTTTVASGTLITAASNALGNTARLVLDADTTVALGNTAQTVGALDTAAASLLDIGAGSLNVLDGGTINGALAGSGSLGLAGLVEITGANPAFSADIGITGTTIADNTAALGETGALAIAADAEHRLDNAAGAFSKTLAGPGSLTLANNSAVTLTAANTAYTGTFALAEGTRLIASTDANLGSANLTGAGTFEKQNDATTITLTHANAAFTGATIITGGTLALADLAAPGSGDIANNASLDLAASGIFANSITGSGTTHVGASLATPVILTGINQTTWHITGAAQVSTTENLGDGATHIDGALSIAAATAWDYANTLTGTGLLSVNLSGGDFSFNSSALQPSSPFTGTVALASANFALAGDSAAVLENATLQLDADSRATVGDGIQQIAGLTLNGGRIDFDTTIPADMASPTFVQTATFAVTQEAGTIGVNFPGLDIPPVIPQLPLLQQDEGKISAQLVSADEVTGDVTSLKLVENTTGEQISDAKSANINQSGVTVATGTYDYGLAAIGDQGAGLYVTYGLTAVDILADRTLTLDQDAGAPAGADDFTAKITGSGNLAINAAGAITLTNADNAYTGATTVATGTLIAGNNNILGNTALLELNAAAAFDLNGNTQAIGAIDTAAGSLLELNAGALTIAEGGAIDGELAGSGELAIAGGTLAITGVNTAFKAATAIAPGAAARITHASGLGSAAIALDGDLHVDNTANGEFLNTLAGAGLLRKTGGGDLTLAAGSPGFDGNGEIAEGRVIATRLDSLGTASITVADAAAFEHANVAGTLQNALSGDGTHYLSNSYLTIASAASYTIKNTAIDSASALYLAAHGIRFGALNLNGGRLLFATPQPDATASIDTLGGDGGEIVMRVQLDRLTPGLTPGGLIADHLIIGNSEGGSHNVLLDTGGAQSPLIAENMAVELITLDTGSATFLMSNPGGKIESGMSAFELLQGDGTDRTPDPGKWYLTDRNISHAADAILNTAATLALDWAFALDSLHQRLCDLRSDTGASLSKHPSAAPARGKIWMRGRGYRLTAKNDISGLPFTHYGWGLTAGVDRAFHTGAGANILGLFVDAGSVNRTFDNDGTGSTASSGAGAYVTLLKTSGWFADAAVRLDRYDNKFESRAINDNHIIRGKYKTNGASLSLEAGRHWAVRNDGWWVEPALQMAALRLNGKDYRTDPLPGTDERIAVRVADSEVYQYRARVRFGRHLRDSRWQPYGKFAIAGVHSSGGEIESDSGSPTPLKADFDGPRAEFGAGAACRLGDTGQLYLDYEYALASTYQRPWSLNLGYRRSW